MKKISPDSTSERQRVNEMITAANTDLDRDLWRLIRNTQGTVAKQMADLPYEPPSGEYFAFVIFQRLFLELCGADGATREGGSATHAKQLIENLANLSRGWSD